MNKELRFIEAAPIGIDPKNERRLQGYAVVWNSISKDLGGFVERFQPDAFSEFLGSGKADVRAFVNHDTAKIIGRQSAGTLSLSEDDKGLRFAIDVANTTHGNDVLESVKRGDISGMSFGFSVAKNGVRYDRQQEGPTLRTVQRASLLEVSPVTFPAYEATSVFNRSEQVAEEMRLFQVAQDLKIVEAVGVPPSFVGIDLETYKRQIDLLRIRGEGT